MVGNQELTSWLGSPRTAASGAGFVPSSIIRVVVGPKGQQPWLSVLVYMEQRGICIFEKLTAVGRDRALGVMARPSVSCLFLERVGAGGSGPCACQRPPPSVRSTAESQCHFLSVHVQFCAPFTCKNIATQYTRIHILTQVPTHDPNSQTDTSPLP